MRRLVSAIFAAMALALVAPPLAGKATDDPGTSPLALRQPTNADSRFSHVSSPPQRFTLPAPVRLTMAVGYHEQFRATAWVPVRVVLRNFTSATLAGAVRILDEGGSSRFSSPSFASMYSESVVLPAGGTKQVTLYLPGEDVGDLVNVQFRVGTQVLARGSDSPAAVSDDTVTVGTLSGDPQLVAWMRGVTLQATSMTTIGLTPATLDPVGEALANFDAIVLSNVDSSHLTYDQWSALQGYVQNGGSLLLVGGPDWQETLRPLPRTLLPGTLAGSQMLPNLVGLRAIGEYGIPQHSTIVSRLIHPQGSVVAQQAGIPLIVRHRVGQGRVLYLAFDPAVDPVASWHRAGGLATSLIQQATPQVINRLSISGFQFGRSQGRFGTSIIRPELANVAGAMQPTLLLLVSLVLISILVLGPLNFLVFRRLRRPELAWIALPVLAVGLLVVTVNATRHLKGNLVLLNTVGVVEMGGNSQSHPAALYVGLFSSVQGTYHMVWKGRALPQSLPEYSFDRIAFPGSTSVGASLSEGAQTAVDFPSMNMWETRSVALRTTVTIPGTVRGDLQVAPDGSIVGKIRNDTDLTLLQPALQAGSAVLRLADLPPHASRRIQIRPTVNLNENTRSLVWDQIYGTSQSSGDLGSWDGDPWEEPMPGPETSFIDRLRNVGERLPGGQSGPATNGVLLLGWTENSFGSLTVDGATPRRRDLNLIEVPLAVRFPGGTFHLRRGTLSPYLVDGRPQAPQNGCCSPPSGSSVVGLGPGGSAVFQFDIPNARHLHFSRLIVSVNADGADGSTVAQVYDWRSQRWVHVALGPIDGVLPAPSRFISSDGALQVRVAATPRSGDILISDPLQDVQLSGTATVG